jgi:hypothetical protein
MPYPWGIHSSVILARYMGSCNFAGALADFLAAVQGSNLRGGNHAAAPVDRQVANWCKEIIGSPASASGTLVSGGSMANLIRLAVASQRMPIASSGPNAPIQSHSILTSGCTRRSKPVVPLSGVGPRTAIRSPRVTGKTRSTELDSLLPWNWHPGGDVELAAAA